MKEIKSRAHIILEGAPPKLILEVDYEDIAQKLDAQNTELFNEPCLIVLVLPWGDMIYGCPVKYTTDEPELQ